MKQIINVLKKLTEFQSTQASPQQKVRCLRAIERVFSGDFLVQRYSFKGRPAIVLSNTRSKRVDFILAGHIDVVPAEDGQYQLKIKGDKLSGRGVLDMKGPLLAGIFAIRDFLKKNKNLKVAILVTSDEEIDGLSVKYLLDSKGYKANFAILPDGGGETEIVREQKGFLQVGVKIQGKPAHASRPWEAENPVIKALDLTKQLSVKFKQPTSEQDWKTSITLTKIKSGRALNQIPKECNIYFDIRYISEKSKEEILGEMKKILKKGDTVKIIAENGPFRVSEDNIHLRLLKRVIEENRQKNVGLVRECATSDAVFFTQNGIPVVLFRPKGGGLHAANEWVDKKSLFLFYEIILNFLQKFNGC